MRRLLIFPLVVLLSMTWSGVAMANPEQPPATSLVTDPLLLGLITNNDVFSVADLSTVLDPPSPTSPATQHYGPYASGSGDSGCGITEWAMDTFDRHFTVKANGDGTFTVVEQFKNGSFVTELSISPGELCPERHETVPDGFISAGVIGTLQGYFIITGVLPQTSNSPYCDAVAMTNSGCTTTKFINTHFVPCYPAVCMVTTFFFHYAAGDQMLVEHEWKNASPDRGGNSGDIASLDPD